MKSLIPLIMLAFLSFAPGADATPVIWSFFETAIVLCNSGIPAIACVLPPQPFVLMTLTLPDATSAGSASWPGFLQSTPPVYTGDSFAFRISSEFRTEILTPAFSGVECNGGGDICDFNLSWSETAGKLDAVSISVDWFTDGIGFPIIGGTPFGLTGGSIGSDNTLGGCRATQCRVAGFWQSDLRVPEPSSIAMLATCCLGLLALRRR